jgi:hypothetical protein
VAATVFAERARGSGYQDPVSGWVDQLRSDDTGQIVSALDAMKQHEWEAVPTEVLVALVVPLLEDHRGFSRFLKEPGAMDSVGVERSVSLCAAKAFGSRTYKDRVLVPVLAEYVLSAENAHCETMATAMMRMVGATKDPDDVEIAAVALYEIMIHDPWTAEERPWERIESLKSPRVCDHRDRAKRMLHSLAMSYPEVAFLDVLEGFDHSEKSQR